jgi:hypothetical protein
MKTYCAPVSNKEMMLMAQRHISAKQQIDHAIIQEQQQKKSVLKQQNTMQIK